MTTLTANREANTSCLADVLWKKLRGLADDGLARRAAATRVTPDNRIRGEVYLFIVDVIAHEVDRLDQEPKTPPGRAPEEALRVVDLAPPTEPAKLTFQDLGKEAHSC
jgi:hypothetical protein